MLLHRLREYALHHPEAAPFHRQRGFSWRISLDADGRPLSRELQPISEPDARGKPRPVAHTVPTAVRAFGVAPNLAADDVQYVLGWTDESSKASRVAECHAAFVDLVYRWADSADGQADPIAQAVARFYRNNGPAEIHCDQPFTAKDGVLIMVEGDPAYRSNSVAGFWSAEVARRKGSDRTGLCLVCGEIQPLLDTVPRKIPARLAPGATNDAALVSVNKQVFGYDLTTQLSGSPLCLACAEAVTKGLHGVLDSRHATTYSGQDSRLAWWLPGGGDDRSVRLLFEPKPDDVTNLIASVHTGRGATTVEAGDFCSLTVGGNVARVMVRDWVQMPLWRVEENIAKWFADNEIVTRWEDQRPYYSLTHFVRVTGRWLRDRQRYAEFGAKGADRPDGLQRDLLRAAIRDVPLPRSLLAHLVHRVRTDGRLDEPRAALIRLVLIRPPFNRKTLMPKLDETNTDPGYVAGRVFAALEQLQYDASEGKLNTTYGDRFFSGAVLNPRAAIVNGRRDAPAWLRKLRRSKRGAAVRHEKRLTELFDLLNASVGLPARTTLSQQSMFLIGYHHQRAHHFASLSTATTPEETP